MTENKAESTSNSIDLNVKNKYLELLPVALYGCFSCIIFWLLSVFMHLSDPDVSGIHEFAKISILFSVTFWALVVFVFPALIIIAAHIFAKTKGYIVGLLLVSVAIAFFLTQLSQSGVSFATLWKPSGFLLVVFSIATYPIVKILNRFL